MRFLKVPGAPSPKGAYDLAASARVLCVSDLHGRADLAEAAVREAAPDVVLLLGDAGAYWPSDVPVYAVLGNHEDWALADDVVAGRRAVQGLTIIPSGTVRRIEELDAVAGALGGVWSPSPRKRSHFRPEEAERLRAAGRVDVLLTHESPCPLWRGCPAVTALVAALGPALAASGHVHTAQVMRYEGTGTWLVNAPRIDSGYAVVRWEDGAVAGVEVVARGRARVRQKLPPVDMPR